MLWNDIINSLGHHTTSVEFYVAMEGLTKLNSVTAQKVTIEYLTVEAGYLLQVQSGNSFLLLEGTLQAGMALVINCKFELGKTHADMDCNCQEQAI